MKYRVVAVDNDKFKLRWSLLLTWHDVVEDDFDPYRHPEPVLFDTIAEAQQYAYSLHYSTNKVVSEFEV